MSIMSVAPRAPLRVAAKRDSVLALEHQAFAFLERFLPEHLAVRDADPRARDRFRAAVLDHPARHILPLPRERLRRTAHLRDERLFLRLFRQANADFGELLFEDVAYRVLERVR